MKSALAVAVLVLCTRAATGEAVDAVYVTLQATARNTGQIGRAFLLPEGGKTRVQVEVSGVPPMLATRPVHLYTYLYSGRCDQRSPKPAFSLLDRVLAQSPAGTSTLRGPYTVSNTAPVPLGRLLSSPYAIVVQTSPADGGVDIFCGNVER